LRTLDQPTRSIVAARVTVVVGNVHVMAEDTDHVRVTLRPEIEGDPIAADLIERAVLRFDGVTLGIEVPGPPSTTAGRGRHIHADGDLTVRSTVGYDDGRTVVTQVATATDGSDVYQSGGDFVVHDANRVQVGRGTEHSTGAVRVDIAVPTHVDITADLKVGDLVITGSARNLVAGIGTGDVRVDAVGVKAHIGVGTGSVLIGTATRDITAIVGVGAVRVRKVFGKALLRNGNGGIEVGPHGGSVVEAQASLGTVTLRPAVDATGSAVVRTSLADVRVIGKPATFDVDAKATLGSVHYR
jgi:hypothetical protein